jgi:hypothetical protein
MLLGLYRIRASLTSSHVSAPTIVQSVRADGDRGCWPKSPRADPGSPASRRAHHAWPRGDFAFGTSWAYHFLKPVCASCPNLIEPITATGVQLADERTRAVVAGRADEYRRRAQQCLEMAAAFRDRDARVALSHMAEAWLRLAERNDLMPPVATAQAQPLVQQQQQIPAQAIQLGPDRRA